MSELQSSKKDKNRDSHKRTKRHNGNSSREKKRRKLNSPPVSSRKHKHKDRRHKKSKHKHKHKRKHKKKNKTGDARWAYTSSDSDSESSHNTVDANSNRSKDDKNSNTIEHATWQYKCIGERDYYSKNSEFRLWLLQKKKLYFTSLSTKQGKKYFAKFVAQWNKGVLPEKYYIGISAQSFEDGQRTAHQWKFRGDDERQRFERELIKDQIDSATNDSTVIEQIKLRFDHKRNSRNGRPDQKQNRKQKPNHQNQNQYRNRDRNQSKTSKLQHMVDEQRRGFKN